MPAHLHGMFNIKTRHNSVCLSEMPLLEKKWQLIVAPIFLPIASRCFHIFLDEPHFLPLGLYCLCYIPLVEYNSGNCSLSLCLCFCVSVCFSLVL